MCKEKEMTLISFPNSVVNISLLNNSKAFVSSSHLTDGKIAILFIYLFNTVFSEFVFWGDRL